MKSRYIGPLFVYGITFVAGLLIGTLVQKTWGVGNVLRTVGIPYPTSASPATSSVLLPVEIPHAHRGAISLFILAGQSNMSGWAPVPPNERTNSQIYVFSNDYRWRIAREPIDDPHDQVDKVSEDHPAGFSPALAFAFDSLERQPAMVIGLIPCAKGSSAIVEWQRNLSDQSLYGSCLKRARAASPMGHISGILFFQGETDAQDPERFLQPEPHPYEWADLFTAFITDLRKDLNDPELPVVFAQLGAGPTSEDFPNWNIVKEQQASLELPMTTMITTDDLPLRDGLHFTTDSYRIIGRRFADAYWDLME